MKKNVTVNLSFIREAIVEKLKSRGVDVGCVKQVDCDFDTFCQHRDGSITVSFKMETNNSEPAEVWGI